MKDTIQIERLTEISALANEIAEGLDDLNNNAILNMNEAWVLEVTQDRTATMRAKLAEMIDIVKVDKARKDRHRGKIQY